MSGDKITDEQLRERLADASPFDQVSIARLLAGELPSWPTDIAFAGDGELANRLAVLLTASVGRMRGDSDLEPRDADDLVALLFPIALSDQALITLIRVAVDRNDCDETMNAIEVLAYGSAISLVIFVATTEVDLRFGKRVRIVKKSISDGALVKLIELIERALKIKTP